jgi:CAAX prenyl protease-like protein
MTMRAGVRPPIRPSARQGITTKPGAWGDLVLTLPVFLAYQLGVIFLNVRNGSDIVTSRLLLLAEGDRLAYFGLTAGVGVAMVIVFALLGRRQVLRFGKLVQVAVEGAAYALLMGTATSWIVGRLFAGPPLPTVDGPWAGLVMSMGAGFYEELAFRVALFGLGAKLLAWLLQSKRVAFFVGTGAWAIACAMVFSGVHYVGSLGDAFEIQSFVARTVLGLALTLVYGTRGFAAAVWTHALYDVWVLVL